MTALLEKLLPVLLIIALGWLLRKKKIISGKTVDEVKQLIVYFALPFTLFRGGAAFLQPGGGLLYSPVLCRLYRTSVGLINCQLFPE
jgi:predicted permease